MYNPGSPSGRPITSATRSLASGGSLMGLAPTPWSRRRTRSSCAASSPPGGASATRRPRECARRGRRRGSSLAGRLGLQVAHRDREGRIGLRLDDAEAGRELRQRRLDVGAHRERKRCRVLQGASRLVAQIGRQLDAEVGRGGEGRPEHRLDGPALVRRRLGVQRLSSGPIRTTRLAASRETGAENCTAHRPEGGAAPGGILALAGQLRGERGTRRPGAASAAWPSRRRPVR